MDFSGVSPEALVQATLRDRDIQTQLEAQVSVVKSAQEVQANAVMALMMAVPVPQPEGRTGHQVDVRV